MGATRCTCARLRDEKRVTKMRRRGTWATRFGIYFAAIGSAFGLGSLWRFPYVVAENGGGAFVALYFFLLIVIGVPLLIGELLIGKVTNRGVLAGQRQLVAQAQSRGLNGKKRFLIWLMPILAGLSIFCCVFILGYYSVVSGWVLHFFMQFLSLLFSSGREVQVAENMSLLRSSAYLQMLFSTLHIASISIVVAKGVEDGIEKWVGFIMPVFVGILFVLVFESLSMASYSEAMRFFLYPDFSKLNLSSMGAAIGQLCFTLSVGFATMVTFGSYLRNDALASDTGFRVATVDAATALVAGLLVFPLLVGGGNTSRGPELLFETAPKFLLQFDGGAIFGVFFFLCLYLAALGASISILETVVANICENSQLSRGWASLIAGASAFLFSIVPALSSTFFAKVKFGDRGLLEFLDLILINWIVPVLALIFSQIVVYEMNEKSKREEFIQYENSDMPIAVTSLSVSSGKMLYKHWMFLMKWVVPPIIIVALVLQSIGLYLKVNS